MPTTLPIRHGTDDPARPYGPIGLIVSVMVILALTTLFCLILAGIGFGISSARVGWRETLDRFVDLDPSGGGNEAFREKLAVVVSLVLYAAMSTAILLVAWFRGRRHWRDLVAWKPWSPFHGAFWFWGLIGSC